MVNRCKFGKGVSFSPCAVYANKECSRDNGDNRAVLICKVLYRASQLGSYDTTLPLSSYDTTKDARDNVYVKYYDDEFYPEYVAYYTNHTSYQRRYFW